MAWVRCEGICRAYTALTPDMANAAVTDCIASPDFNPGPLPPLCDSYWNSCVLMADEPYPVTPLELRQEMYHLMGKSTLEKYKPVGFANTILKAVLAHDKLKLLMQKIDPAFVKKSSEWTGASRYFLAHIGSKRTWIQTYKESSAQIPPYP
ncbi:hypothetical protein B0H17DRAFT_1129510 [Mycena rosella]|uniref:Uncharacterized protein n=1 Tax=Mycena rosella TaxID=1033263 RepID=A0AAD7DTG0_MYCRO|nr:hypothetical protein B0H17DRAFT_1129510 [Mycena rosella]